MLYFSYLPPLLVFPFLMSNIFDRHSFLYTLTHTHTCTHTHTIVSKFEEQDPNETDVEEVIQRLKVSDRKEYVLMVFNV